jgi:hypothetical protein
MLDINKLRENRGIGSSLSIESQKLDINRLKQARLNPVENNPVATNPIATEPIKPPVRNLAMLNQVDPAIEAEYDRKQQEKQDKEVKKGIMMNTLLNTPTIPIANNRISPNTLMKAQSLPVQGVMSGLEESEILKQKKPVQVNGKNYPTMDKVTNHGDTLKRSFAKGLEGLQGKTDVRGLDVIMSREDAEKARKTMPVASFVGEAGFEGLLDPTTYIGLETVLKGGEKLLPKIFSKIKAGNAVTKAELQVLQAIPEQMKREVVKALPSAERLLLPERAMSKIEVGPIPTTAAEKELSKQFPHLADKMRQEVSAQTGTKLLPESKLKTGFEVADQFKREIPNRVMPGEIKKDIVPIMQEPPVKVDAPYKSSKRASTNTLQNVVNNPAAYPPDMVQRAKQQMDKINVKPVDETGYIKRGLINTVQNSNQFSDEVKQGLTGTRGVKSNQDLITNAQKLIQQDPQKAMRMAKSETLATDLSNEVAHQLIEKANLEGRFDDAIDLIEVTAKKATESGRATQALSMWARLSPEGMQKYAQRVVNQANQKFAKLNPQEYARIAGEFKQKGVDLQLFANRQANMSKIIQLTAADAQYINSQMAKVATMQAGRQRDVVIAQTLDYISGKIPPTLMQKVSTLQTMAQLLNPKTAIRNTFGNLGFAVMENISDAISVPIDRLVSLKTGNVTKAGPDIMTQLKGFKKGWGLGLEDALLGIDTSGIKTQFDIRPGRTFRDGFFGGLEKAMNVELKATDRAFYTAAFDKSLKEQMTLAKVATATQEMIEQAHLDGLYRTFQDTNTLSSAFKKAKDALNGGKEWGLGDVILKYPKTPANILARGIDYSPVGIVKSMFDLNKALSGSGSQKRAVENLARGVTGSGLMFAAVGLYNLGIITGKNPKDKEAADLMKETGQGQYSINTSALKRWLLSGFDPEAAKPRNDDSIMNYDWLQPQAISVSMGANMAQQLKDKNRVNPLDVIGAVVTSLQAGANTLAEQPLVQGVANAFRGYDVVESMTDAIKGVPGSFVPTFLNQVRQMFDSKSRNVSSDEWYGAKESLNLVMNKLSGLSGKLPERITTTGNVKDNFKPRKALGVIPEPITKAYDVFLNPAFSSKYNTTPGSQLLLDMYKKDGDVSQFPRTAPKYITVNGERIPLSIEQQNALQKEMGTNVMRRIERLAISNRANSKTIAEDIKDILDEEGENAREKIIQMYRLGR